MSQNYKNHFLSMTKKALWFDPQRGDYISLRDYNKYAKKASRLGKSATEYLAELGLKKVWGESKV